MTHGGEDSIRGATLRVYRERSVRGQRLLRLDRTCRIVLQAPRLPGCPAKGIYPRDGDVDDQTQQPDPVCVVSFLGSAADRGGVDRRLPASLPHRWVNLWEPPPESYLCWRYLPLVLVLAAIAYRLTGQYTLHRLRRFREEMVCVIRGTVLLSFLVMATTFYLHDEYDSRVAMLLFSVLTTGGLLAARRMSWMAIRRLRSQGYNQTRALIVGTGPRRPKDRRRPAPRELAWHQEPWLRRGQPEPLDRRPQHPGHVRRSAAHS